MSLKYKYIEWECCYYVWWQLRKTYSTFYDIPRDIITLISPKSCVKLRNIFIPVVC